MLKLVEEFVEHPIVMAIFGANLIIYCRRASMLMISQKTLEPFHSECK